MVDETKRKLALEKIQENIARTGRHIYVVAGGAATPRFAYTIGVSESIGAELILAGASFYRNDDVAPILNAIAVRLKPQLDWEAMKFEVGEQGSFTLRKAHASWATEFMRGALDYYDVREVPALQVVPDKAHWTIDVPDLSAPWNANTEPVWRWLHEPWTYPVPEGATAATDLEALRGERVTEAMRWEEGEWEIFVGDGPNIPEDELRMVPLGTLLGADESLVPVVNLAIGEGLLRDDPDSEWRPWPNRK
ncbi:MAG TPA: DUF4262 domain-containing protein [Candidatus Angelobacter sp.]|jgi:hypothetical protein|nr:DUF4262 domain-containing protein [Candidatus Angelobacter sp.]